MTPLAHDDRIGPGWSSVGDVTELCAAWVGALGELEDVARGREAVVETKAGGSYRYRYADLGDVLSQARAVLARHGLAVFQVAEAAADVTVTTTVMHTSGAWLTFAPFRLPAGNTAQSTGSAITYARRYCLMSILGLATDDDDGAAAGTRDADRTMSPDNVARFVQAAADAALTDAQVAEVVQTATGGRTTDPAAVYATEVAALRAALDTAAAPRHADTAAPPPDDIEARAAGSPSSLHATRAQLATLRTVEDRAGLGMDRLDVRRAVIGRDATDEDLIRAEADRLIAAMGHLADGAMAVRYSDDGSVELIAGTPVTPGDAS